MFEVRIEKDQFQTLAKNLPERMVKAMASVLKSESFRLRGELKAYAQAMPTMVSPLGMALRKQPIGTLLSRVMAYEVDEQGLSAEVGILEKGKQPARKSLVILAKRQAAGYRIQVTRKAQRRLAGKLEGKHKVITERRAWERFGGLRSFIPRIGLHKSMARSIVAPVWEKEKARTIANLRRNFTLKMTGGRY